MKHMQVSSSTLNQSIYSSQFRDSLYTRVIASAEQIGKHFRNFEDSDIILRNDRPLPPLEGHLSMFDPSPKSMAAVPLATVLQCER